MKLQPQSSQGFLCSFLLYLEKQYILSIVLGEGRDFQIFKITHLSPVTRLAKQYQHFLVPACT